MHFYDGREIVRSESEQTAGDGGENLAQSEQCRLGIIQPPIESNETNLIKMISLFISESPESKLWIPNSGLFNARYGESANPSGKPDEGFQATCRLPIRSSGFSERIFRRESQVDRKVPVAMFIVWTSK